MVTKLMGVDKGTWHVAMWSGDTPQADGVVWCVEAETKEKAVEKVLRKPYFANRTGRFGFWVTERHDAEQFVGPVHVAGGTEGLKYDVMNGKTDGSEVFIMVKCTGSVGSDVQSALYRKVD